MKVGLVVTDMDGTAVRYPNGRFYSSWDALVGFLSPEERVRWFSIVEDSYGKKDALSWFQAQMSLLKGKRVADAEPFLFPIPYSPGFREFFGNSNGLKKAILSAGIDLVARKIAEELDFHYWIAQTLEIRDGIFTGNGNPIDYRNKAALLPKISGHLGIPLSRTCYIGDTEGDIGCMEMAGVPIAFRPHHGLDKYAEQRGIPCIDDFRQLNEIFRD